MVIRKTGISSKLCDGIFGSKGAIQIRYYYYYYYYYTVFMLMQMIKNKTEKSFEKLEMLIQCYSNSMGTLH